MRTKLLLGLLLVASVLAALPGGASAATDSRRLLVPYRSQLDGDPYQSGNCGPATMAMVIGAFGRPVPTTELRALVNDLQGTWGAYDAGTFVENLAVIAERYGLRPIGLFADPSPARRKPPGKNALRRWTIAEVRRQLDAGYPVVPQVWFAGLPGREQAAYQGDHFIVITGYEGDEFVYNDSIDRDGPGASRRITTAQLDRAWRNSDFPYAALAVAGPDGRPAPTPTPPPAATAVPLRPALRPVATATAAATASPTPPATATAAPPPLALVPTAAPTETAAPRAIPAPPPRAVAATVPAEPAAPWPPAELLAGGAFSLVAGGLAFARPWRAPRRRRG